MKILVVIDAQNDFITGSLGSEEAQKAVARIVDKINNHDGLIMATLDTHDEYYPNTLEGQNLPIIHCQKYSDGWMIEESIEKAIKEKGIENVKIIFKIAFGTPAFDRLPEFCSLNELESIELIGYVLDICVISNALLLKTYYPNVPISVDVSCSSATSPEAFEAAKIILRSCQIEVKE